MRKCSLHLGMPLCITQLLLSYGEEAHSLILQGLPIFAKKKKKKKDNLKKKLSK